MLENIIDSYPEGVFLKMDNLDNAIIGIDETSSRLIYSVTLILEELQKTMSEEEALEYYEFNIASTYMGEKTPILCVDNF